MTNDNNIQVNLLDAVRALSDAGETSAIAALLAATKQPAPAPAAPAPVTTTTTPTAPTITLAQARAMSRDDWARLRTGDPAGYAATLKAIGAA